MSDGLNMDIEVQSNVQERMDAVMEALSPDVAGPLIAERMALYVSQHFANLDASHANKMGGTRTHFYEKASEDVHSFADSDGGINIAVSEPIGLRQRIKGGPIDPVNQKALAIPAIPEAYGKSPREIANLVCVWPTGYDFGWLKESNEGAMHATAWDLETRLPTRGKGLVKSRGEKNTNRTNGNRVFYWLVSHVDQEGDPSIAPDENETRAELEDTVGALYHMAGLQ